MITRRKLLKTIAGLFGAGVSGKTVAQPIREGYWGPNDQKRPPPPPSPPKANTEGATSYLIITCDMHGNAISNRVCTREEYEQAKRNPVMYV